MREGRRRTSLKLTGGGLREFGPSALCGKRSSAKERSQNPPPSCFAPTGNHLVRSMPYVIPPKLGLSKEWIVSCSNYGETTRFAPGSKQLLLGTSVLGPGYDENALVAKPAAQG